MENNKKKERALTKKEIEERSHCLDLISEDGKVWPSDATAIRLFGIALEEVDKVLWKMGGRIGGCSDFADIKINVNHGLVFANVAIDFDMVELRKYVDSRK